MKLLEIIGTICFLASLALCFWVDWRLGLALFLHEVNVAFGVVTLAQKVRDSHERECPK